MILWYNMYVFKINSYITNTAIICVWMQFWSTNATCIVVQQSFFFFLHTNEFTIYFLSKLLPSCSILSHNSWTKSEGWSMIPSSSTDAVAIYIVVHGSLPCCHFPVTNIICCQISHYGSLCKLISLPHCSTHTLSYAACRREKGWSGTLNH